MLSKLSGPNKNLQPKNNRWVNSGLSAYRKPSDFYNHRID